MANQQSKNIQYSGLTTLPDDYQSVDGSLAFATNAVYEDNAVKIIPPALAKNLIVQKGDKVYVHSMATYTHYIVAHQTLAERDEEGNIVGGADEVTLYWVDEKSCEEKKVYCVTDAENGVNNNPDAEGIEFGPVFTIGTYAGTFVDLAFVGNTVILSTSEGRYYNIWSAEGVEYKYLGDRVPRMDIHWGLNLELGRNVYFNTGIELEKEDNISPSATDYSPYSTIYYDHIDAVSRQYYPDTQVQLHAGTTYRCYQESYRSKKAHPTLQGFRDDKWRDLVQIPKTSREYTYYTAGADYEKIRLVVDKRKSAGMVYIEEGDNSSGEDVSLTVHHVKNTSANFTAVMGCVNKFVNSMGKRSDRFVHPFFLRYAVRLYDGTHCNLSAPVLLYPNTGYTPFLKIKSANSGEVEAYAFLGTPCYNLASWIKDEWKDIIQGVDVFVSQQFYPYDQGQGFEESLDPYEYLYTYRNSSGEVVSDAEHADFGIGRYSGGVTSEPTKDTENGELDSSEDTGGSDEETEETDDGETTTVETAGFYAYDLLYQLQNYCYYSIMNNSDDTAVVTTRIAARTQSEIEDDIVSCCNYYKIGELTFDEIGGENGEAACESEEMIPFTIEHGTLNSLETRETLKEEEVSVGSFHGANLYVYNNRLHIYGGERTLPEMYGIRLQNGWAVDGGRAMDSAYGNATSLVRIRTDEGIKTVYCREQVRYLQPWFFYPDTRAYEYWERVPSYTIVDGVAYDWVAYSLRPHDFLNGAYMLRDVERYCLAQYDGYTGGRYDAADAIEMPVEDKIISNLNKIYVSEASNPFVFKNGMVCTAGSGQVLALSSAAKALSQGQFGQFPLYAFTDEGIWAMSVGSTGAYETVQPIARDVVPTDAVKAITQLDSAVVFVTDRGVMLIEGSNVVCMSDDIDGDFGQFDPRALSDFYDIMKEHLGFSTDDTDNTIGKWASQPFFDFIRSCRMKYDYVHQRITMYSDDCDIAYVYSLKSKQWLMQLTALQDNVNSYPDAYALRNTEGITYEGENGEEVTVDCTELVNLSEYDLETERRPMVFVTRPFKLDAPDTFKTVNDIIQRGYFRQDKKTKHIIGTVLYGSPDLFNWFAVKSNVGHKIQNLQGSPYKYFRVLVVSQLDAKEGISGCSVWFEPKDTQRLR